MKSLLQGSALITCRRCAKPSLGSTLKTPTQRGAARQHQESIYSAAPTICALVAPPSASTVSQTSQTPETVLINRARNALPNYLLRNSNTDHFTVVLRGSAERKATVPQTFEGIPMSMKATLRTLSDLTHSQHVWLSKLPRHELSPSF